MTVKEWLATAGVAVLVAGTVGFFMQSGEEFSGRYERVSTWQPEVTTEIPAAQLVAFSPTEINPTVRDVAELDLIRPDDLTQIEARAVPTLALVPLAEEKIN